MDSIANAIAQCDPVDIEGKWHRHVPARYIDEALDGIIALSRWGRTGGFPILHLGKPVDSVVVEAYRHLVDPVDDPAITAQIAPRRLVTCDIAVSNILDLRSGVGRLAAGISVATLTSETTDREAYEHCRRGVNCSSAWTARNRRASRHRDRRDLGALHRKPPGRRGASPGGRRNLGPPSTRPASNDQPRSTAGGRGSRRVSLNTVRRPGHLAARVALTDKRVSAASAVAANTSWPGIRISDRSNCVRGSPDSRRDVLTCQRR